ncbi:hypothetical protein D5282_08525 [bacterium 1xD8-48]|nr:hypothetical protein [bacterium 1xD8-48]
MIFHCPLNNLPAFSYFCWQSPTLLWEISIYPPYSSPAEQILNQTGNYFPLFDENASHRLQIYFMLNSIE